MREIYLWIVHHAEILNFILDVLSLLVTITLTITIFWLEQRNNKKYRQLENKLAQDRIRDEAKKFLVDNDEEIEYLPLSHIACKLGVRRKHTRNVTTNFIRCSSEIQREVLTSCKFIDYSITKTDVDQAISLLEQDLQNNHFGRNLLYDGAKYFHKAIQQYSNVLIEDSNPYIFEHLLQKAGKECDYVKLLKRNTKDCLSDYMWYYLHPEDLRPELNDITPPIDMLYNKCNLGYCSEDQTTFWIMRMMIDACYTFRPNINVQFEEHLIQTQEDMYYYTVAVLYAAYIKGENNDKA